MEFLKSVWELVQSGVPRDVLIGVVVFLIGTSIIGIVKWLYHQRTTSWQDVWAKVLSPAGWIAAGVIGVLLLFGLLYRDVRQNQNDLNAIREMILALKSEPDVEQASGQPSLNPNARAVNETSVDAGFWPDPEVREVVGGGPVDAASLGRDCIGYATEAPSLRLQWNGESDELRIFFTAADEEGDSTLLVHLPDGSWLCNDDSGFSLNPLVLLDEPQEGQYNIWVASYRPDRTISGELSITELNLEPTPFLLADQ